LLRTGGRVTPKGLTCHLLAYALYAALAAVIGFVRRRQLA